MAHRGSRHTTSGYGWSSANSLTFASVPAARPFNIPFVSHVNLLPVEDLRAYHPLGSARSVRVSSGVAIQPLRVARSVARSSSAWSSYPRPELAFAVPSKTIVCIRRRRRREVLFAKRPRSGRGARRRTQWSSVWCSR